MRNEMNEFNEMVFDYMDKCADEVGLNLPAVQDEEVFGELYKIAAEEVAEYLDEDQGYDNAYDDSYAEDDIDAVLDSMNEDELMSLASELGV